MQMTSSNGASPSVATPYERQLLNLIPPDASVVIELGCADGNLGARYKKRNPAARYVGVEQDATAAATAAKFLDQVITADPGSISLPEAGFGSGTVDCLLIQGPALAGGRPALRLRHLLESVSEQGVLLAIIANSRFSIVPRKSAQGRTARPIRGGTPGVFFACSLQELQAICKRAGCKAVEVFGAGPRASQDADRKAPAPGKSPPYFIARIPGTAPRTRVLIQSMTLPPIAALNDKRIHEPVTDRKSTRLNSSHIQKSRMPSSA